MNDAAPPVVYADETHNTGEHLRDADQPVFAVAGVHLDDGLANDIVDSVKESMQKGAGEPKYTRLSRRSRGRAILLSAFEALPENSAKVFIADKKFMTISKIIDLGIEPLMFAAGYNMHADESARTLAHMVSIIGPVVGNSRKFDKVLDTFVAFVLQRSIDPDDYLSATEEYLATVEGDRSALRMAFLPSRNWFIELVAKRNNGLHMDTLDPAVPTVVAVCRAFAKILGPIRLVHDQSDVIARNKNLLLSTFPDPADPSRRTDPIGVKEIDFGNSHEIAQLKIADWVAGAARDAGMSKLNPPRKMVSQELYDLVENWLAAPPLWPDQDWLTDRLD
ncbi:MAG: DUF3800 domain-containing protein [Pseudonocardiaceae bacterium]